MNKLRGAAMLVVVLLVLPACHCKERTDSRNITEKNLMNFIVRLIKEVKVYRLQEGNGKQHLARKEDYSLDEKENPMPDYGYYQDEQRVDVKDDQEKRKKTQELRKSALETNRETFDLFVAYSIVNYRRFIFAY
ncbi:hypothetical protein XENTR_v10014909 [Xenopus tropicalis]|nr:hypothetical protein XENTR_v10014909 [Xenopus tropicalis]